MNYNYREQTENLRFTYEDIINDENYKDKIFVELSDVIATIDYIESDVNDILRLLEPIEGLSEINEVKDKIIELSSNLY